MAARPYLLSKVLPPSLPALDKSLSCKSHRLMAQHGLVRQHRQGIYAILPLAQRSLARLLRLVRKGMDEDLGAQEVILPSLHCQTLWDSTGRRVQMGAELFQLQDRSSTNLCLAPTHEECITELVRDLYRLSSTNLPHYFYQITSKFRDERRPRFGLLRAREFLMKDLYTFDASEEAAAQTYDKVRQVYRHIFNQLELPFLEVQADQGAMGGKFSHEFHVETPSGNAGEDVVAICQGCGWKGNQETLQSEGVCPSCQGGAVKLTKGIEVAHTFFLGTRYSDVLGANFAAPDNQQRPLQMGCYGLGPTRLMAASVEALSTEDNIRWPRAIAPLVAAVIPPKEGSKEQGVTQLAMDLADQLASSVTPHVALDDRTRSTIGYRLNSLRNIGVPFAIIVAKKALEPMPRFEVVDIYKDQTHFLNHTDTLQFFQSLSNIR